MAQPVSLFLVTNVLDRGGAEAMLVRLARHLHRDVVRPQVVCFKDPGPLAVDLTAADIPVYSRLLACKYDFRVLSRLTRLLREHAPACIMAVGNGGDRMFWSTLAARRAGACVIVWSHIFPTAGERTFERVNRRLYDRVDAFVALGRNHRDALIACEQIPGPRIQTIPNGIDVTPFQRDGGRREARQRLGIPDDDAVVIGIVANLRPIKRHDLFLDAAARVHRQRPNARFVLIGDGVLRDAIERQVAVMDPNRQYVRVLGDRNDVPALLPGMDVVCLTSEQECLSVAMLEAMAASRPFVAPRVGSLDEALIDGETGRFFDPPTPDALAGILIELIDSPAQRADLGRRAREKVTSTFTIDKMARAFEELMGQLVHKRQVTDGGS